MKEEIQNQKEKTQSLSAYVLRLVSFCRALKRSRKAYDSDMGGWRERLEWELGFAEGQVGLPCRKADSSYEHGHYVARH